MMVLIPSYNDVCKYKNAMFENWQIAIHLHRQAYLSSAQCLPPLFLCMQGESMGHIGLKVDGWSSIVNSSLNNLVLNFLPPLIYINCSRGISRTKHTAKYKIILYRAVMCNYNWICMYACYNTWLFLSGVQFLQLPSPLSKTWATPQIPQIVSFQSRSVMALNA